MDWLTFIFSFVMNVGVMVVVGLAIWLTQSAKPLWALLLMPSVWNAIMDSMPWLED